MRLSELGMMVDRPYLACCDGWKCISVVCVRTNGSKISFTPKVTDLRKLFLDYLYLCCQPCLPYIEDLPHGLLYTL